MTAPKCHRLYTVYDNKKGYYVAVQLTAYAAAKAMGVSPRSLLSARSRSYRRWTIETYKVTRKEWLDEKELEDWHDSRCY